MPLPMDAYEILGVSPLASDEEIRDAYKSKAMFRHRSGALALGHRLRRLSRVYEILVDPERRREHDRRRELHIVAPRREENEATAAVRLHEGRRRRQYRHELARHAARQGELAMRANAPLLAALEAPNVERTSNPLRVAFALALIFLSALAAGALAHGLLP